VAAAACAGHCRVAGHVCERVQRGMADCGPLPTRLRSGTAHCVASLYHAMSSVRRCRGCGAVAQAVGTTPWSSSPGKVMKAPRWGWTSHAREAGGPSG